MFLLSARITHGAAFLMLASGLVSSSPQLSRPSSSVNSTVFKTPASTSFIPASSTSTLCYGQNQDPGLGYLSQFCKCGDGTGQLSFPLSTPTPSPIRYSLDEFCQYTALPCLDCTSMGAPRPLGKCTTIANCNTKIGQTPSSTITSKKPKASSGPHYRNDTITTSDTETHSYIFTQTRLPEHMTGNKGGYWELFGCTSTTITRMFGFTNTHCVDATPISTDYWRTRSTTSSTQPSCNYHATNGTNSTCAVEDPYCPLRGSSHSLDGLEDQCILWNKSCCGDKTEAASKFWGTTHMLERNSCFYRPSPECSTSNPPGRMSVLSEARDWMRNSECFKLHHSMFPDPNHEAVFQEDLMFNVTCCGYCEVVADKVDVYYWPEPDADLSCQSIIGDEVSSVADGATTDTDGTVYWGCDWTPPVAARRTFSSSVELLTTASLTTIASLKFKAYVFNPWDPSPCGNVTSSASAHLNQTTLVTTSSYFNQTTALPRRAITLRPRAHSLLGEGNVSTAVVGTHTFTSPSIYLEFKGLDGGDNCGSTSIPSTMVAFDPGELSTVVGPVAKQFSSSKRFNPLDLPCPPRSVMSENWYTPLPGVPYRPYFAFPDKIRQVIPDLKHCNAFYFNAFDPPRILRPADALHAPTTTVDPKVTSQVPMPSSVQDPGPSKTHSNADPARIFSPHFPEPKQTPAGADPATGGNQGGLFGPKQTVAAGDPGSGGDATSGGSLGTGGDPVAGGGPGASGDAAAGGDPGAGGDPAGGLFGPKQTVGAGDPGSGGDPTTGGNSGIGGDPVAGGDTGASGNPAGGLFGPKQTDTGANPSNGGGSDTIGDPGLSDGNSRQPSAVVPAGEPATPTQKDGNGRKPANSDRNTQQPVPSDLSLQDSSGRNTGNPKSLADPSQAQGTQGVRPQGLLPQGPNLQNGGAQDAGSEGAVSQGGGAQDAASQGAGSQGAGSQGGDSQSGGSQSGGSQGAGPQSGGSQGSAQGGSVGGNDQVPSAQSATPQDSNPQSGDSQGGNTQGGTSEGSSGQSSTSHGSEFQSGDSTFPNSQASDTDSTLQGPNSPSPNSQGSDIQSGDLGPNSQGSEATGSSSLAASDSSGSSDPVSSGPGTIGSASASGSSADSGPSGSGSSSDLDSIGSGSSASGSSGSSGSLTGSSNSGTGSGSLDSDPGSSISGSGSSGLGSGSGSSSGSAGSDSVASGSGSSNSASPNSGSSGSSSSGVDSQGSSPLSPNPGSNSQSFEGEVAPLTTIQLGQNSITGPTTISLGDQGDSQQPADSAGALISGGGAPIVNPGQPNQQVNSQASGGSNTLPPVVTVGSQVVTISDPSAVPIAGTTITPGGNGVNIGGTPVTLGPSGNLVIGSDAPQISSILTIAGNIVTANPTSFDIGGTPVQAGQQAVTVSGVPVSLGSSGNLVLGGNGGSTTPRLPHSLFTVGSESFTANPTAFEIRGSTISAGGAGVTLGGTPVSLMPQGSLIIGSNTIALPTPTPPTVMTTDGVAVTFAQNSRVAVDGSTLSIGGPELTVSGKPVSVGIAGLVIGSNTIAIPDSATSTVASSVLTTNGQVITFLPSSQVAVDGQTLSIDGPAATVSGAAVSVGSGGLVVGSNTIPIPTMKPIESVLTTDGKVITFLPSSVVAVGSQTLSMNGPGAIISGAAVSVVPGGLAFGSKTISFPSIAPVQSVLTTDGQTLTFQQSGQVAVGGQTLSVGGQAATVSGVTMSAGSSGLVIGTDTVTPPAVATPPVLTTDGQIVTFQQSGRVAVDGATLSAGGSGITVSGTEVSVATDGLFIGTDTIPVPSETSSTTSSVETFTAGSAKRFSFPAATWWALLGMLMLMVF